jgi:hypothetical protein
VPRIPVWIEEEAAGVGELELAGDALGDDEAVAPAT